MCEERTRTFEPARALAAETFQLERLPSAERGMRSAECPAEIDLMWKTVLPRMPIPLPFLVSGMPEWGQPKSTGRRWEK